MTTAQEILQRPKVAPVHKLNHAEELAFWQGRFCALEDVLAKKPLGLLLQQAGEKLKELRAQNELVMPQRTQSKK